MFDFCVSLTPRIVVQSTLIRTWQPHCTGRAQSLVAGARVPLDELFLFLSSCEGSAFGTVGSFQSGEGFASWELELLTAC